jgi:ribonuclease HII
VDGDAISYSIACASVVAKVVRDRMMARLAARYPGYGWERNQGYATREHRDAIRRLGLTPFHRRSFLALQRTLAGDQATLNLFGDDGAGIDGVPGS